jgi:hypothetical protein
MARFAFSSITGNHPEPAALGVGVTAFTSAELASSRALYAWSDNSALTAATFPSASTRAVTVPRTCAISSSRAVVSNLQSPSISRSRLSDPENFDSRKSKPEANRSGDSISGRRAGTPHRGTSCEPVSNPQHFPRGLAAAFAVVALRSRRTRTTVPARRRNGRAGHCGPISAHGAYWCQPDKRRRLTRRPPACGAVHFAPCLAGRWARTS